VIPPEEVAQAETEAKTSSDDFLRGVVDFLKWTSTITVAALIWVGNSLAAKTGVPLILSIICLILLAASLAVSIWTVQRVLAAWGVKWAQADALRSFYSMKEFKYHEPDKLSEEKESKFINDLVQTWDAGKRFSKPYHFSVWVTSHSVLLLGGILFYILAQLVG
jgi:hypothetical protein